MPYRFLTFELDTEHRELTDAGSPVAIAPKPFDVLAYLLVRRDRVVPKAELMEQFWSANTTEAALQKTISQVRKALGGQPAIKTLHGRGFRFVAPLSIVDEREGTESPVAESSLGLQEQHSAAVMYLRLGAAQSSGIAGADPDDRLGDALNMARHGVLKHGGTLLHMMTEGFSAAFGLQAHTEDAPRHAVHCAWEVAELAGAESAVTLRFGVDSGLLPAEAGSDPWRVPNQLEESARILAEAAGPGEVVVSAGIREQLGAEIQLADNARGYRLVALSPMRAGIPASPLRWNAPFIGRRAEMTFLRSQLDALHDGSGQCVLLSGPAGIGKTRLVAEFLRGVDQGRSRSLFVQCLPSLSNSPLAPIRALVRALDPEPQAHSLDAVDTSLLKELLGSVPVHEPALQGLSDHQRRERACALLDRLLRDGGEHVPLLVVLEDIHWLDVTSRQYLEKLLADVDQKPAMFILTTRPVDAATQFEPVLHLSSLGRSESQKLLLESMGEFELLPATAAALVERAKGNPFFIEELALAAQRGGDPAVELPSSVQAVIAVRVGHLTPSLRELVYVLAVIGSPAAASMLSCLTGDTRSEVEVSLLELMRRGFLQDEDGTYTFRHRLINDTAYAMLAPEDRGRLHAAIADWLEGDECEEPARPEHLALHLEEAGDLQRAIPYWIRASQGALHRAAHQDARTFAERGLALIDRSSADTDSQELHLLLCLAPSLTALQGFASPGVGQAYGRAAILNDEVGTAKTEVRVRVGLWIHTWVRGQLTAALDHADRLRVLSAEIPDPTLVLQANASLGQVLMHRGELERALAHLSEGLSAIEGAPPATTQAQNAAVSCAAYASWTARMMGRDRDAAHWLEHSRALCASHDNAYADAIHHALGTESFMFAGDATGCLAYADRAIALSREHNFAFWLGTGLVMRGWALGRRGEFAEAFASIDDGIAIFEATGAGVQLANWHGLRAETLLAAGHIDEALAAVEHALECSLRAEDLYFLPRIHSVAAACLCQGASPKSTAEDHRKVADELAQGFAMHPAAFDLDTSTNPDL